MMHVPTRPGDIWAAYETAKSRRASDWDGQMEDIYRLMMPWRDPRKQATDRAAHIYDSTAPRAILRFAGRLKNDIAPALREFFTLELGPAAVGLDDAQRRQLKGELKGISEAVSAGLSNLSFNGALQEMCVDLVAGQGALLMTPGEKPGEIDFEAVPAWDIYLSEGKAGKVCEVFYPREMTVREICASWPDLNEAGGQYRLPRALSDAARAGAKSAELKVKVLQATIWDRKENHWVTSAIVQSSDSGDEYTLIHRETSLASPWITPRFFKVPGMASGIGPAQLALPDVRVVNKTVELVLRAAALAILGLWTRTQGLNSASSLNLAQLAPGSIIPVDRNGGPRGAELARLELPGNIDLTSIVLRDLRENIRDGLFDRDIPQSRGDTPLPASQIIEHVRAYAEDLAVVYGRLVMEVIEPLVNRAIEILAPILPQQGVPQIDRLLLALKVTSPLAEGQDLADLDRIIKLIEMVSGLLGEQVMLGTLKVEDLPEMMAEKLGVPIELIRSETDRADIQTIVGQVIAQMQQGSAPAQPA